ncbi:MAG: dihydroorotate dehydrogenase electron transfer subunit [Chloroflexota bacterium]|nr:dihydroorotate dehydrogenase electron transfer subunit [Chloroflexota bacterium]
MKQSLCVVISKAEILPGVFLMKIAADDIAAAAHPGQFISVRCGDLVLRRPFSIHQVGCTPSLFVRNGSLSEDEIAILFKVVGEGSRWLSQLECGDEVDILGPLGNGFSIAPTSNKLLLVAGGIGIAPLALLAQYASAQYSVTLIHGASTVAQLYPLPSLRAKRINLPPLPREVRFIPVTEDGSMGRKGIVTDMLPDLLDWADQIFACGPVSMYKAMSEQLHSPLLLQGQRSSLKCQVSLELRMGCGIGACYGCTINTKKGLKKVCHDGPIFELDDILWEEIRI